MIQPGVVENQLDSVVSEPSVPEFVVDESSSQTEPAVAETTSGQIATKTAPVIESQAAEKDRVAPPVEDDLLTELLSEPFYLAASAGGIVLLAMLGWALVRRRNRIMMVENESILSAPDTIRESIAEDTELKKEQTSQTQEVGMVAESSFLSEFTPSDFDALETDHDDVDPISEADVYLAYGRYQQAEDLIRSAIENYPERDECKLKLLEIHYATEDRDAYESYAKELESFKSDKPEFWAKVAEMGREICPQSTLFSADLSVDQADLSAATQFPPDAISESPTGIDLGDTEVPGLNETEIQGEEDDFGGGVDIAFDSVDDLDETIAYTSVESELQAEASEEGSVDENSIEFDAFMADNEDNSLAFSSEISGGESEEHSAESGLDFTGKSESNETEGQFEDDLEDSIETLDFDMDIGESDDTVSDLTDMDEIETKLDLAKAYVDMDDQDSARGILSEILVEGNDDQKNEAQALVDVLENKG